MLAEVVRRESLEGHRLVFAGIRLRVLTLLQPLFSDCGPFWSLSEVYRAGWGASAMARLARSHLKRTSANCSGGRQVWA